MLDVVCIGQSPRPDLEAEIAAAVPGLPIRLRGALDGLSRAELDGLAPRDGADTLYTTLPSGEGITVSKAAVTARMRALVAEGGGPLLLACTGEFKGLPDRPGLVQPSAVLNALAGALLPHGRLGIVVPLPEQAETLVAARRRPGLEVIGMALRPQGDGAARAEVARAMAAARPDLVLLDCISYTRGDRAAFTALLPCPVLLAAAVAARVAASLLPE
ncbi:AroM family protein [Falsiroseomonas sp. CW058]|uniref:AroM family protein n=1 Tax=Falsiroseomonas sp. CW058 TaxID=3388664 RepID=UPI003D321FF7